MEKDKTGKYLKYAIGEIVLVVIGILIALWLNNLNLKKQERIEEISILKELKKDLLKDKKDFKLNIGAYKGMSNAIETVLNVLDNSDVYNDSLDAYFAMTNMRPISIIHDGSFRVLSSKGFELISSDSLREKIVNLHGHVYTSMRNWENEYDRNIYFDVMIKRFDKVEPWKYDEDGKFKLGKMKPNNFGALKTDLEYKSVIRTIQSEVDFLLNGRYKNILQEVEHLVTQIDDEIIKLE